MVEISIMIAKSNNILGIKMKILNRLPLLLILIVVTTGMSISSAQSNELEIKTLQMFSLEPQVSAMKGHDIRARKIVVPAGAKIQEHQHSTTPGIVYVESGSIVEYRGGEARTLHKGDSLVEDVNTVHSYFNSSPEECVLIAFDLPNSKL
jgi:quercetin dioxygenase-like cupin family protein